MDLKDHQLKGNMQKRVQPPSRHWESTHVFSILLSLLSVPRRLEKVVFFLVSRTKENERVGRKVFSGTPVFLYFNFKFPRFEHKPQDQ